MENGGYMKKKSLPELVALVQKNNEEAFNELYRRYYKLVRYIAFGLTKSDADTDEVLQEVFIQVQKSIKNLKEPELFKSWISRITYSKSKMLFRKKKDISMQDPYLDLLQDQKETRKDFMPYEKTRHDSDMEVLKTCIHNLKPNFQEVLIFYYFSQMSIKEISELTNDPEGTVKSRLLYAKKYLKTELEEYERKSGQRVTFHGKSLEAALSLCGASLLVQYQKPILTLKNITIPTSTVLMLCKVCLASVLAFGGAYAVYDYSQQQRKEPSTEQEFQANPLNKYKKEFTQITFQGKVIATPREAYKNLIEWADCEVEMRKKNKEELDEANIVYQALMNYGEGYASLLKRRNWDQAFQNELQNK